MNEWLTSIAQSTVVIGFFCAVFSYIVIKPFNESISRLRELIANQRELIEELKTEFKQEHERREEMYRRLIAVEQSAKSAHHRLDEMGGAHGYESRER